MSVKVKLIWCIFDVDGYDLNVLCVKGIVYPYNWLTICSANSTNYRERSKLQGLTVSTPIVIIGWSIHWCKHPLNVIWDTHIKRLEKDWKFWKRPKNDCRLFQKSGDILPSKTTAKVVSDCIWQHCWFQSWSRSLPINGLILRIGLKKLVILMSGQLGFFWYNIGCTR